MATDVTPIMVRARVTADEWAAIRKLAIDLNQSTAELVADALRDKLGKHDEQEVAS